MAESRRNRVYSSILIFLCLSDFSSASNCTKKVVAGNPRYDSNTKFDEIHVISTNHSSNISCTWEFSSSPKFVLNFFFVNFTTLEASAGSECSDNYAQVTIFDAETKTIRNSGPYCGQNKGGIRINGTVTVELFSNRKAVGNVTHISMAVLIESSTKTCGGIFRDSWTGVPVSFDSSRFGISRENFVHCVWYIELSTIQNFKFLLSDTTLYHDSSNTCSYYKEFISIRSWDEGSGRHRKRRLLCKTLSYSLPMILPLNKSKMFAVTVHSERYYGTRIVVSKGVGFFASAGLPSTDIAFDYSGNKTFNGLPNSNSSDSTLNTLVTLRSSLVAEHKAFAVVSHASPICKAVQISVWNEEAGTFYRNQSICKNTESKDYLLMQFMFTLALQIQAEASQLSSLQILYFSTNYACGGVFPLLPGQKKRIQSPKTSLGSYPADMYCQWSFIAKSTTILNVTISSIDLESCKVKFYDYIEVYRGFRSPLDLEYKICTRPLKDISIQGDMTIHFHSDSSVQKNGFDITVVATEVVEELTTTTLPLTSSPCCKSFKPTTKPKIFTTDRTKEKEYTRSTSATAGKAVGSRREDGISEKELYGIGIGFGIAALVFAMILSIIFLRKRSKLPIRLNALQNISNNLERSRVKNMYEMKRMSTIDEVPMEHVYGNPLEEAHREEDSNGNIYGECSNENIYGQVLEKETQEELQHTENAYANTLAMNYDVPRRDETTMNYDVPKPGETVYETMDAATAANGLNIENLIYDQYICPESQAVESLTNTQPPEVKGEVVSTEQENIYQETLGINTTPIKCEPMDEGAFTYETMSGDGNNQAVYSSIHHDEYVAPNEI